MRPPWWLLTVALVACTDGTDTSVVDPTDADGDGVSAADDCDDNDSTVYPGADEVCNGVDDDCNGQVDDEPVDAVVVFEDSDGDGHGVASVSERACSAGPGWSVLDDDCDDAEPLAHPGRAEVCLDGINNDCLPPDGSCALEGDLTTSQAHLTLQDTQRGVCLIARLDADAAADTLMCSGSQSDLMVFPTPLASFPRGTVVGRGGTASRGMFLTADHEGDGAVDLVLHDGSLVRGPVRDDSVPTGGLSVPARTTVRTIGDFDGDGLTDAVFYDGAALYVVPAPWPEGAKLADAASATILDVTVEPSLVPGSFGGSAADDLLIVTTDSRLWTGGSKGEVDLAALPPVDVPSLAWLPDLSADGADDLWSPPAFGPRRGMALWGSGVSVWAGAPYATLVPDPSGGVSVTPAGVGDLNGDGETDLLTYAQQGLWHVFAGSLEGELAVDQDALVSVQAPDGYAGASGDIGDLDGDGRGDLLILARSEADGINGFIFFGHAE